jgi:hypothetical protein
MQIDICCFSGKHAALRRKSKDWSARNQDNVSEWGDMSIRGLHDSATYDDRRKSYEWLKHQALKCNLSLFKESMLSEQLRESEAIIKLLNFLA